MKVQQGVQMFMIPKANSSCKEQVSHEFEATAKLEVDEEGYEAMREPLSSLTVPESNMMALPAMGSPSHSSNIGVPTCSGGVLGQCLSDQHGFEVVEDYSEDEMQALVIKLKPHQGRVVTTTLDEESLRG